MAKPCYIICCESGSEDKLTGLVSHFKVLEEIELREIARLPDGSLAPNLPLTFQIVAVWQKEHPNEPDEEYDFETSIFLPPGNTQCDVMSGFFRFDKLRFRVTCQIPALPIRGGGMLRCESRIKRRGDDAWLAQTYEIQVLDLRKGPGGG
jgi:hypothetical protein